jgi:hypothetical protein
MAAIFSRRPSVRSKPLSAYLKAGGVGELIPQAEKLLALRRVVHRILPPNLRMAAQVANLKAETLILQTSNNATAAKLKHCANSLSEGLAREGYHVAKIKVEVRPEHPVPARASASRPLPPTAAEALRRLERDLPADSSLRRTVGALANKKD